MAASSALPGPERTRRGAVRWLPRTILGWTHVATSLAAAVIVVAMVGHVAAPIFRDVHLLAGHDWDEMEGYRELVVKTMRRFHQFPFWNPYTCGGHPLWSGVESDTTIVSPFFPFYLALPLPMAMRIEFVGNALISCIGAWLFAGRFTRSPALRAFVVVVFAVNGRWALQIAAGHTWHYAYEWTPWALYFVDRAFVASIEQPPVPLSRWSWTPPWHDVLLAGASLAMMVYMGGIYPLPQTVVAIAIFASVFALRVRDFRPLLCAVGAGLAAFAFSAPKLLPLLDTFRRFPRYTDSSEWMDVSILWAVLTAPDQDFGARPANVPQWGWHEWGMYVGVVPVALVVCGLAAARGERARALFWTAVALLALAFGAVHPYAPWPLLHQFSMFRSQHVPSRWLYPAWLVAAAVASRGLERGLVRSGRVRWLVELAAIAAVAWIANDVAHAARLPLEHAFERPPPRAADSVTPFRTEIHMPPEIGYPTGGDWSPNTLPNVLANVGMVDCGSFFQFHNYYRDHNNHAPGLGAKGKGDPAYHGEVFVAEGRGTATVTRWTPNAVEVHVVGAQPGDHLILNQNWDAGWGVFGHSVVDWADLPAAVLRRPDETVTFRYVPRGLYLGLGVAGATLAAIAWSAWAARKVRRARARAAFRAPAAHVGIDLLGETPQDDAPALDERGPARSSS